MQAGRVYGRRMYETRIARFGAALSEALVTGAAIAAVNCLLFAVLTDIPLLGGGWLSLILGCFAVVAMLTERRRHHGW